MSKGNELLKKEIEDFAFELYSVANRDTAYPKSRDGWTEDNSFLGIAR